MNYVSVSEAARLLSSMTGLVVKPQQVSQLYYNRVLPDSQSPIFGGRRLIPQLALSEIANLLTKRHAETRQRHQEVNT